MLLAKNLLKFRRMTQCLALTISSLVIPFQATSSLGLPGQSLDTVRRWTTENPVIPEIIYNPEVQGYTGLETIQGGLIAFLVRVNPENNQVTQEQITTLVGTTNLAFTRDNEPGLELLGRVYDAGLVNDFRESRYVAKVGTRRFYQGERFAYIASDRPLNDAVRFNIIPITNLRQAIEQAKFCQVQTAACNPYHPFYPF